MDGERDRKTAYELLLGARQKKSIRQASRYVSGRLNRVLSTYTRFSSSAKNLFGYSSYTSDLLKANKKDKYIHTRVHSNHERFLLQS